MKPEIVQITEAYNGKGELVQRSIKYESRENYGYFEQLPKKAEKWLERAKKEATYINETKTRDWTYIVYRKEGTLL